MNIEEKKHKPVLLKQVLAVLPKKDGIFVDVTLGSGGHSLEILKNVSKDSRLIAIDSWGKNVEDFKSVISNYKNKNKIIVSKSNFADIDVVFSNNNISGCDFLLADLGWSTDQLDTVKGLAWSVENADLDMRLNESLGLKASDLLNILAERDLKMMFSSYADIHVDIAKKLTQRIIKSRPIKTTNDFNRIIEQVINRDLNGMKSRIYQALRIAVNSEFENLKNLIRKAVRLVNPSGIIAIITFHSGEESLVQNEFKSLIEEGSFVWKFGSEKKFLQPDIDELKENISSRSAKLWLIQRVSRMST